MSDDRKQRRNIYRYDRFVCPFDGDLAGRNIGSVLRFVQAVCTTAVLACAGSCVCFAQSTKAIDCPGDRVYRDNRDGAGGEVFCEQVLPGSLRVKDGPSRFWFNRNFEGASGNYNKGREVGKWKECQRFGQCEQKVHIPT